MDKIHKFHCILSLIFVNENMTSYYSEFLFKVIRVNTSRDLTFLTKSSLYIVVQK
jgi:hypothetical protein